MHATVVLVATARITLWLLLIYCFFKIYFWHFRFIWELTEAREREGGEFGKGPQDRNQTRVRQRHMSEHFPWGYRLRHCWYTVNKYLSYKYIIFHLTLYTNVLSRYLEVLTSKFHHICSMNHIFRWACKSKNFVTYMYRTQYVPYA